MNMCAACLRRLYLEKYSGITVRFPFNLGGGVSICCTAFLGDCCSCMDQGTVSRNLQDGLKKIPVIWGYVLTWIFGCVYGGEYSGIHGGGAL